EQLLVVTGEHRLKVQKLADGPRFEGDAAAIVGGEQQEPVANDAMPNGGQSVVQHDDIGGALRQALYVLANRGREIESPRRRRQLRKQNAHVDVAQRATFSAREGSKKAGAINLRPGASHDVARRCARSFTGTGAAAASAGASRGRVTSHESSRGC